MTEKNFVFECILGDVISGFIKEKRAVGYKYTKASSLLKQFDTLATKQDLIDVKLPKEMVLLWTEKRPNETVSTRNGRISITKYGKHTLRHI
ncbi:hypothetical protein QF028_000103 [Neobacillus sp. B4I6]|uniref:hypothetical protein n=1 Tax=Neobacillus sp. B4I6 TaxID=3373925 RepID=UPI003D263487